MGSLLQRSSAFCAIPDGENLRLIIGSMGRSSSFGGEDGKVRNRRDLAVRARLGERPLTIRCGTLDGPWLPLTVEQPYSGIPPAWTKTSFSSHPPIWHPMTRAARAEAISNQSSGR